MLHKQIFFAVILPIKIFCVENLWYITENISFWDFVCRLFYDCKELLHFDVRLKIYILKNDYVIGFKFFLE